MCSMFFKNTSRENLIVIWNSSKASILPKLYYFLYYIYSQVLTTFCYTLIEGYLQAESKAPTKCLLNDRIQDANWTFLEALHRFGKLLYVAISLRP